MTPDAPKRALSTAGATPVAEIERELEALIRVAGSGEDPEHPIIRACMSNLLVLCRTDAEAAAIRAELPDILALHPARSLVLLADEAAKADTLEARLGTHTRQRDGAEVFCGESVTLTGRGGGVRRLAATARALLLGDLPTTLWWATPEAPARGGPLYAELSAMASQVIFDSLGWLEPVRGMTAMGRLRSDRPLLNDICWRRLRGWRRILSQGFDPAFAPSAIEHLGALVLEHGPHALTQAWLLVGWLARRVGWRPEGGKVAPGTEVTWRFHAAQGPIAVTIRRLPEGPPEVRTIEARPASGRPGTALRFESGAGGRLTARSDGGMRTLTLAAPSRAAMVARQLSDLVPDPIFRDTLAAACQMAASLPH
jgi:glucose-6-phosphate dehydrogenase assembly protein OpcA